MDRLEPSDWAVGAGGLVLVISAFMPWYSFAGWSGGAGYGWLVFVLGAAALTWALLNAFDVVDIDLPFPQAVLYLGAGGLSALIAVLRLVFRPGGFGVVSVSPHIGIFFALAGAAAVIVGGVMKFREE